MRKAAPFAWLAIATLIAGCGNDQEARSAALMPVRARPLYGADVWLEVEKIYENLDETPPSERAGGGEKAEAKPAKKHRRRAPTGASTAWRREYGGVAEGLLDGVLSARGLAEGELGVVEVKKLELKAWLIRRASRKLLGVTDRRERERRITGLAPLASARAAPVDPAETLADPITAAEPSDDDLELADLAAAARRVDAASRRFWRAAAKHSPRDIKEWWKSLLIACRNLPGGSHLIVARGETGPRSSSKTREEAGEGTGEPEGGEEAAAGSEGEAAPGEDALWDDAPLEAAPELPPEDGADASAEDVPADDAWPPLPETEPVEDAVPAEDAWGE